MTSWAKRALCYVFGHSWKLQVYSDAGNGKARSCLRCGVYESTIPHGKRE